MKEKDCEFIKELILNGVNHSMIMGFVGSVACVEREDAIRWIANQLPFVWEADEPFIDKSDDYVEIGDMAAVFYGSRMWYLEYDKDGFYWIGNTLYGECEWDNDSIVRFDHRDYDRDALARDLYDDFVKSGNKTDNWNE